MEKTVKEEIRRQSVHFSGMIFVIASYFIPYVLLLAALLIVLSVAVTHCFLRPVAKKFPIVRNISDFLHSFARPGEVEKKIYLGASHFFIGMTLALVLFNSLQIFRIAVLVLIVGDSFSTIFGKLYGKHKISYNKKKSIEGSFTGFIAAFLVILTQVSIPIAFLAAFIGMFVESLPMKIDDNLTIPLIVGIVLWFLI